MRSANTTFQIILLVCVVSSTHVGIVNAEDNRRQPSVEIGSKFADRQARKYYSDENEKVSSSYLRKSLTDSGIQRQQRSLTRNLGGKSSKSSSSTGKGSKSSKYHESKFENRRSASKKSDSATNEGVDSTTPDDTATETATNESNDNNHSGETTTADTSVDDKTDTSDIAAAPPTDTVVDDKPTTDNTVANDKPTTDKVVDDKTDTSDSVTVPPTEETTEDSSSLPPATATATVVRTVQLSHPTMSSECMAHSPKFPQAQIQMINCTTSIDGSTEPDHWEMIVIDNTNNTTGRLFFFLRHKMTQMCIPQNPEHPDQPFDCFRYSGEGEAIADSINGLVACDSGFAATMVQDDTTGSVYLYNTDCLNEIDTGHEEDVFLMSYHRGHQSNGTQIVMWGENIILNMTELVELHNFQGEWEFIDV
jgi:hypothetical protein